MKVDLHLVKLVINNPNSYPLYIKNTGIRFWPKFSRNSIYVEGIFQLHQKEQLHYFVCLLNNLKLLSEPQSFYFSIKNDDYSSISCKLCHLSTKPFDNPSIKLLYGD